MAAEDFFTRWSKKKSDAADYDLPQDGATESQLATQAKDAPPVGEDVASQPAPTQEDVEKLTHESDYSAFMADGVDESVKRSAMKKLFSNPHFNIMDGLDVYIEDYSKFEPISPALLASLSHAKALLDPLSQLKNPIMSLLDKIPAEDSAALDEGQTMPALDTLAQQDAQVSDVAALPAADSKSDYAEQHQDSEKQDSRNEDNETPKDNVVKAEDVQELKTSAKFDDV